MARLFRTPVLLLAVLALGAAACSSSSDDGPKGKTGGRPAVALTRSSPYEAAVLKDGATALWPLRDADGLGPRDRVADLSANHLTSTVVGGTISGTKSPSGARAATFALSGHLVTPIRTGLTSSDTFTLELALRADVCATAWGRVLGTSDYTANGREGLDFLHFPSPFLQSPCRFGVELWHAGGYVGGCHAGGLPPTGVWQHWAVVYKPGKLTCYVNGKLLANEPLTTPTRFSQPGPLGIGGNGSGYQGPLDGASLSEVAYYDRDLTAAQVRRHVALLTRPETVTTATPSP